MRLVTFHLMGTRINAFAYWLRLSLPGTGLLMLSWWALPGGLAWVIGLIGVLLAAGPWLLALKALWTNKTRRQPAPRRRPALGVVLLAALALAPAGYAQVPASNVADLIIHRARVVTLDPARPTATAVAVRAGKLLKVGADAEVLRLKGPNTRVVDAQGRTLIPGLNDSHLHVIRGGRFFNTELRWDGVKSLRQGLDMVRAQVQRTPAGQWVKVVGGWSEHQFAEKRNPTLAELNAISADVPIFILHLYGRAWLNKAGLRAAGFTRDSPNPPGGTIEKDAAGEPTGLLLATPNALVLYATNAKSPALTFTEQLNSTQQFLRDLNRFGLTSAIDAGGGFQAYPEDYAVADTLARRGQLTLRVPYYLFAQKAGREYQDYVQWVANNPRGPQAAEEDNHRYYLDGGGENLVASAADFENFEQTRPELPAQMEAELRQVLAVLVEKRWPFRLHATYDESISRFLSVLEDLNRATPFNGLRWYFDHAETISDRNLARVKALGGGIAIQNRMAFQGEAFVARYGKAAAAATPPVKKMLALGLPVGLGTDATRVSSYNPWVALHWLVSGRTVGGTVLYPPENRLDRRAALQLYTSGSARLTGEDAVKGRIQEGYYADLALLSADYFAVPEAQIPAIEALLTVVDGRVVYGAGAFAQFAPKAVPVVPAWSPAATYNGWGGAKK
ncbi:amidohydrolase [Hymenobacter sp.]|uniref:amidohydrolase n=1 Tax=Hymenobacter sp. TaxID=1898978 RepID=UPI00286BF00E|nr:amidohydrolase [Hymenobacter sp.]